MPYVQVFPLLVGRLDGWLVGWMGGLSVGLPWFPKGEKSATTMHAPIGALINFLTIIVNILGSSDEGDTLWIDELQDLSRLL